MDISHVFGPFGGLAPLIRRGQSECVCIFVSLWLSVNTINQSLMPGPEPDFRQAWWFLNVVLVFVFVLVP